MDTQNNSLRKKILLIGSILSIASTTVFAGYGWHSGTTISNVNKDVAASTSSLTGNVNAMNAKYVTDINANTSKIVEAIRVAVNQEALGTVQKAQADKDTKQLLVSTMAADQLAEEQLEAYVKFSPSTGQGYAACKILAENTRLDQVMSTVGAQAADKVLETDNAPGVIAAANSEEKREAAHKENFCTPEEAEIKKCTVKHGGAVAGADSNAGTLFVSAKPGSVIAAAKKSVRQNILGSPIKAIPPDIAKSAEGKAYLLNANHKTALAAFPAYSLAYIESMSEVREDIKDKDGKPMSPNDMLFNTVARYYGGKDADEWQKAIIQQQPRGILVELAKMEGLATWMEYQEFLANQRIEGNLAAMTLTNALPIEDKLRKQSSALQSEAIRDAILLKGR